jgi:hypothetical protein
MVAPASTKPSAAKEPSTKLGQFYRAHRPEVLAGAGVLVGLAAWWKTKHPSSASSSTSSTIDPATGDPAGSAADQAALAEQQAAASGSTPYSVTPGGGDGSTGYSSGGYGGDNGSGSDVLAALQGIQTTLTGDQTLLQGLGSSGPDPEMPANPAPGSPSVATKRTAAQAEAITTKNLAKDKAAEKASPSAKNKAAVTNLTKRLNKEKG